MLVSIIHLGSGHEFLLQKYDIDGLVFWALTKINDACGLSGYSTRMTFYGKYVTLGIAGIVALQFCCVLFNDIYVSSPFRQINRMRMGGISVPYEPFPKITPSHERQWCSTTGLLLHYCRACAQIGFKQTLYILGFYIFMILCSIACRIEATVTYYSLVLVVIINISIIWGWYMRSYFLLEWSIVAISCMICG